MVRQLLSRSVELDRPYLGFLSRCLNLEHFATAACELTHEAVLALAAVLSKLPNLRSLDLSPSVWNGELAHELVDACPTGLTSYRGTRRQRDVIRVVRALQARRAVLTVVHLDWSGLVWTAASVLQTFLCMCPRLQTFSAMGSLNRFRACLRREEMGVQRTVEETSGERFCVSSWACEKTLKCLHIIFKSRLWDTETGECVDEEEMWIRLPSLEEGEPSGHDREFEFIPEALVLQLGRLHQLEKLWLGRTTVPVGAGFRFADMTDEQNGTSRAQMSKMLQALSTLRGLRSAQLCGLKNHTDMDEFEIVRQQWKCSHSVEIN
ncbi:hypothetical protein BG005_004890 [Podila minutissima]|nr:hypothetical protein BG005_004890 [Podila minutissima]